MVSIRHNTPAGSGQLPWAAWDEDHDAPIATQAEAEAGIASDKLMTPERTAQAIAALGGQDGQDGQSVTIITFTDEAAFNAATPGALELLVLVDA